MKLKFFLAIGLTVLAFNIQPSVIAQTITVTNIVSGYNGSIMLDDKNVGDGSGSVTVTNAEGQRS